jgi:hypothetical protein
MGGDGSNRVSVSALGLCAVSKQQRASGKEQSHGRHDGMAALVEAGPTKPSRLMM